MKYLKGRMVSAFLTIEKLFIHLLMSFLLVSVSGIGICATTLNIDENGKLTGVTELNVAGNLYDVEFVEGTCIDLFSGCDAATDFDFPNGTSLSAQAASLALLNAIEGSAFENHPENIYGCGISTNNQCLIATPNAVTTVVSYVTADIKANSANSVSPGWQTSRLSDTSVSQEWVYADWSPTSVIFREDFEGVTSSATPVASAMEREDGTYQPYAIVPGWLQSGSSYPFMKINGVSGNTALLLNESGGATRISREISGFDASAMYQIEFEYWADNMPSDQYGPYMFYWSINGEQFNVVDATTGQNTGNFHTISYDFMPTASSLVLLFHNPSTGPSSPIFDNIVISRIGLNEPPVANAGLDQSIRAGNTVWLDGLNSYDDNTPSSLLNYSWSFTQVPVGSSSVLSDENNATPSFFADLPGDYIIQLIVTDEGGLTSTPSLVTIGTDNLAPTSAAGPDQLVIVGSTVYLSGAGSSDPENDLLEYTWTLGSKPQGSLAELSGSDTVKPSFIVDLEGIYNVSLMTSDFLGEGTPDSVEIVATTTESFVEYQVIETNELVTDLSSDQVTTQGNQEAFNSFLNQVIIATQSENIDIAIDRLLKSIARTDGCILRGTPDLIGQDRDWITDCTEQGRIYQLLKDALDALLPQ